jgi:membrane-associated phospholipid phosphatase
MYPMLKSSARRVGVTALVAWASAALVLLLVEARWSVLRSVDLSTSAGMNRFTRSHSAFRYCMKAISDLGSTPAWIVILGTIVALLLRRGQRALAGFVVLTAVSSTLLNWLLKSMISRARPSYPDPILIAFSTSFPSGHSQAAAVGYGLLLIVCIPLVSPVLRPWLCFGAALMVGLIAFSRVALAVHYFSDVLAGVLVGVGVLASSVAFVHGKDIIGWTESSHDS